MSNELLRKKLCKNKEGSRKKAASEAITNEIFYVERLF